METKGAGWGVRGGRGAGAGSGGQQHRGMGDADRAYA